MAWTPTDDFPGPAFRRRYKVLRELGAGAFGVVVLAEQLGLDRMVAVKFLLGHKAAMEDRTPGPNGELRNSVARRRFEREARKLVALEHPNIVRLFDYGVDGAVPFIVEEFLEGEDLATCILRRGALPVPEVARIGAAVAEALACAHAHGVIHRDLKPANVFLTRLGAVKLIDLGLAKNPEEDSQLTEAGVLVGTPIYVAPEVVTGGQDTVASDLYSLGVMFFEMLTAAWPFAAEYPKVLRLKVSQPAPPVRERAEQQVPDGLAALVDGLLDRDPAARPSSAAAVRDALAALLPRPPQPAASPAAAAPAPPRAPRARADGPRRDPVARWLATALLVLAASGAALWGLALRRPEAGRVLELQVSPTRNGARVTWTTEGAVGTALEYAPTGGRFARVLRDAGAAGRNHEVALLGLEAGRDYAVRPLLDGAPGPLFKFRTLPAVEVTSVQVTGASASTLEVLVRASDGAACRIDAADDQTGEPLASAESAEPGPTFRCTLTSLPSERRLRLTVRLCRAGVEVATRTVSASTAPVAPAVLPLPLAGADVTSPPLFNGERACAVLGDRGLTCWRLPAAAPAWSARVAGRDHVLTDAGEALVCAASDGGVLAVGWDDGAPRWQRRLGAPLEGGCRVADGSLLLRRADGRLVALDAVTGAPRWTSDEPVERGWSVTARGTVAAPGPGAKGLVGLDPVTGRRLPGLLPVAPGRVTAGPLPVGDELAVGLLEGRVVAGPPGAPPRLDRAVGGVVRSLAAGDGRLYVETAGPARLLALALADGREQWSRPLTEPLRASPLGHRERLYVVEGATRLLCLDGATGRPLWQLARTVRARPGLVAHPEGVLFCTDAYDVLVVRDR